MFKRKSGMNPNLTDSLIGEGSIYEGRIKSQAGIRIEGQVTGEVQCEGDVTVGTKGVVRSDIRAREVVIAGEVHGNVYTQGRLTIRGRGRLYGNTNATALVIDEGGIFQGLSRIEEPATTTAILESELPRRQEVPRAQEEPRQQQPAASSPGAPSYGGGPTVVL